MRLWEGRKPRGARGANQNHIFAFGKLHGWIACEVLEHKIHKVVTDGNTNPLKVLAFACVEHHSYFWKPQTARKLAKMKSTEEFQKTLEPWEPRRDDE